jgi:hypothetical protein
MAGSVRHVGSTLALVGQGGRTMSEANPKGYNFQVRVTGGHEAEAKAAEMAKKPNRLGMFIVKLLGGKGKQDPH